LAAWELAPLADDVVAAGAVDEAECVPLPVAEVARLLAEPDALPVEEAAREPVRLNDTPACAHKASAACSALDRSLAEQLLWTQDSTLSTKVELEQRHFSSLELQPLVFALPMQLSAQEGRFWRSKRLVADVVVRAAASAVRASAKRILKLGLEGRVVQDKPSVVQ